MALMVICMAFAPAPAFAAADTLFGELAPSIILPANFAAKESTTGSKQAPIYRVGQQRFRRLVALPARPR